MASECFPFPLSTQFHFAQRRMPFKKFLSGSEHQLPIEPTSDHRQTLKKKSFHITFQVSATTNSKYSLAILNNPMIAKGIPIEGAQDTILPRSRSTPKDSQRKIQTILLRCWQQLIAPKLQTEYNPYLVANACRPHLSSHIFGASNLTVEMPIHTRTDNLYGPSRQKAKLLQTKK